MFIYCTTRKSRRKVRDERFKDNLGQYIKEVPRDGKTKAFNLDDLPDQSSPMLGTSVNKSPPLAMFSANTSGNVASSEASEHVSKYALD